MKWYPIKQECVFHNDFGHPFEDLTCVYPVLKPLYTDFEARYGNSTWYKSMIAHPEAPIIVCVLYIIGIVFGRKYFENRPAWSWRTTLALWNFSLSAFSLMGVIRVLPALVHIYSRYSWKENFCFDPESHYGTGASGLWIYFFVLSKFPELLDTFFIVIHKKPLIFLHWYHHVSVLLFCWQSYVSHSPVGIIFCVMNYAVHSFMYFYYFLMAIHKKPKFINALYITLAQISQMVVGVTVTLISCYLIWFDKEVASIRGTDGECALKPGNIVGALVMYGSYLFLFLQFFIRRYFNSSKGNRSQNKGMSLADEFKGGPFKLKKIE